MRTTVERAISALTHAVVVFQPHGLLVGLIVFFVYHSRSEFVFSQVKQALGYQVITFGLAWVTMTGMAAMGIELPQVDLVTVTAEEDLSPLWAIIGLYGLTVVLYGLYGAWKSFKGEDFRYILIGKWLESL